MEKKKEINAKELVEKIKSFCEEKIMEIDCANLVTKIREMIYASYNIAAIRQTNGLLQFEFRHGTKINIFICKS